MGQEQSYAGHASVAQVRRYKDKYDPTPFTVSPVDFRTDYEEKDKDFKRHKARRSAESFKSDNSTESSGYRSGSSAYECRSDRSYKSDYYCTSLYKNDHYKDVNKELYKPVKISKEKRYKLPFEVDKEDIRKDRLNSYLNDAEAHKSNTQKKGGIRNYTPKILSEEDERKQVDKWI
ncbi:uncharacterized protein LOC106134169 [Amyelois transitella]|uniref:uncharacterized protein LOC106134169 n=1 Tax=Amyelois transitella TaxID=680683 RepID=UPI00067D1F4B|nr:uncharacterized protein LOC106134169 [Amyelois transitella]